MRSTARRHVSPPTARPHHRRPQPFQEPPRMRAHSRRSCPPPAPARTSGTAQTTSSSRSIGELASAGVSAASTPRPSSTSNRHRPDPAVTTRRDAGQPTRCQTRNCSTRSTLSSAADSPARLQPAAEPPDLPQLVDRRQRRIATPPQLRRIHLRERGQRPRHQHPARPGSPAWPSISSFSDNKKDDDRQNRRRYADIYAAISPVCKASRRRHRHNTNVGIFVVVVMPTSAQPRARARACPRRLEAPDRDHR